MISAPGDGSGRVEKIEASYSRRGCPGRVRADLLVGLQTGTRKENLQADGWKPRSRSCVDRVQGRGRVRASAGLVVTSLLGHRSPGCSPSSVCLCTGGNGLLNLSGVSHVFDGGVIHSSCRASYCLSLAFWKVLQGLPMCLSILVTLTPPGRGWHGDSAVFRCVHSDHEF